MRTLWAASSRILFSGANAFGSASVSFAGSTVLPMEAFMAQLRDIPRPEKLSLAHNIHTNLVTRQNAGPPEPALDGYIPELAAVIGQLDAHVGGASTASTAWQVQLGQVEMADIRVDTWYRHIESFLFVEANRRSGPEVIAAAALYAAACPDGLAHVNARVPEENAFCRSMLAALRDPVNAATLAAIELPPAWLDRLEDALDASDAAHAQLVAARHGRSTHLDLGRDAEEAWVDVMGRLSRYVDSRASKRDVARRAEGEALLAPLLDAMKKMRAAAATRRTRRQNQQPDDPAPPSA